ncbi:hypothetical protein G7054_g14686 [Neopestalotiopsis clavispora]|nr:hypothetical protein G7054_g14686 [Neopestalotiopsis clavispora]
MATTSEESSRIFVRNLPPTITQADFEAHLRKHFSNGHITDIKLLPQRRIGYVGYKTPDEAKSAVKKFHRSFIRMSKVSVEIAKPIADPSLQKRWKNTDNGAPAFSGSSKPSQTERPPSDPNQKKRKRDDPEEADAKLQEYLDVMGASKNPSKKTREVETMDANQPPVVVPEGESDDEYEEVPSRQAKSSSQKASQVVVPLEAGDSGKQTQNNVANTVNNASKSESDGMDVDQPSVDQAPPTAVVADDDDWLRSRTNRLLDLVNDDEEMPVAPPVVSASSNTPVVPPASNEDTATQVVDSVMEEAVVDPASDNEKSGKLSAVDTVHKTARIFVRNLPYSATEEELHEYFGKFGELEEILVPAKSNTANNNQGYAFVTFSQPDDAVKAFQNADRANFQGRMLHVIPGSAKRQQLDDFALSKLPLKAQAKLKKKAKAGQAFNWNSLYMAQDAVLSSTADRLGVSKSELLDPTNSDAAVKQALAETSTIQDTKAYFLSNGVDLDSFKSGQRSDTVILVKNFPYGTTIEELRNEFQEFGQVLKVLMPPTGTIAIVLFAHAAEAKTAFSRLAYRRFKNSILFLEKGPKDLFVGEVKPTPAGIEVVGKEKISASDLLEGESTDEPAESSSIFVKNLSFNTTTAHLHDAFKHLDGYRSSAVKTKSDPKKPGQVLSMGFGFVSFSSKASAEAAAKSMDGQVLQGHKLVVRTSHRGHDAAEQRRKEDAAKKAAGKSTKIILKNLPFEASKKDIRSLMGAYGQLRTVRLPKNAQNRSKGYAFCEFTTSREADNAMTALKDTHLLGRKLVLEFAEAEDIDPEEVIARMAKKTGRQNAKVTLHQLIGGDRKKITIGAEEEGEGDF